MPQRLSAQRSARSGERRGRSNAPAGRSTAGPSRKAATPASGQSGGQYQAPEVAGVLDLQREFGNRAVAIAAASGQLPSILGIQRAPGAISKALAMGSKSDADGKMASTITAGLNAAIAPFRAKMQHLPSEKADMWIGIIDAYTKTYRKREDRSFLFSEGENLYELLAPWGFVGKGVQFAPGGKLVAFADVENLMRSIRLWRAEDARTRKKRRASTHSSMGMYDRDVDMEEVAYADQQVLAGPSRDSPIDPMMPTSEGTRANRRSQREDMRNQHALEQMGAIKNQGPGGFAGMIAGGIIGSMPGMDFHKTTEFMMQLGSMADALIMTRASAAEMQGISGGAPDRYTEASHTAKAPEREPMPTPDMPSRGGGGRGRPGDTMIGMGAAGPAGQGARPTQMGMGAAGPAGIGARPKLGVGYLEEATPGQVISAFKRNPHYVRHSNSDAWHMQIWRRELIKSGKWNPHDGPAPPAPMAFHLKNGMLQVNDNAWFDSRGSIEEIMQPHERPGAPEPHGSGGGGRGGTQVGHTGGAGSSSKSSKGGAARSGDTQIGFSGAPQAGVIDPMGKTPLRVPDGPPPVAPGNTVRPASHEEAKALFKADPNLLVFASDKGDFHQYVWELQNWYDGKRVTSKAPAAFHMSHGQIRVNAQAWLDEGGKLSEVMKDQSQAGKRAPNDLESANTLPGGGGGSTMGGD